MQFLLEIVEFLDSLEVEFVTGKDDRSVNIPSYSITLCLASPEYSMIDNEPPQSSIREGKYRVIVLYEDLWRTHNRLVKDRLIAIFGKCDRIFARNCIVSSISSGDAKKFLDRNHLLGYAKARYRYALYGKKNGVLYAVATFSKPRWINRDGLLVRSYEWVRYSGISEYRIVGGMSKLMAAHIDSLKRPDCPSEIMSYADRDWSDGDSYRKLGFVQIAETRAEEFFVDSISMKRIPAKRANIIDTDSSFCTLQNSGNFKFVRSFSF